MGTQERRLSSGAALPPRAGIGLRHPHVAALLDDPAQTAWIEVHSENYLGEGGPRLAALERLRRDLPLSCHGVGLSLGSAGGLDRAHLDRLARLYARLQPALVSEHAAWSVAAGHYLNDLLPLPYTEEALDILVGNVIQAQDAFRRPILVENPSTYLRFAHSTMPEWEFMAALAAQSGCGLLLDVNNIHVAASNHGFDPADYLAALPAAAIGEIHVAGHSAQRLGQGTVLIDDHGATVAGPVWALLRAALARFGPQPVLVEWDTRIPPLPVLLAEAAEADRQLAGRPVPADG